MKIDATKADLGRALGVGKSPVLLLVGRRGVCGVPSAAVYPGSREPVPLVPGELAELEKLERAGRLSLCRPFVPAIGGRRRLG